MAGVTHHQLAGGLGTAVKRVGVFDEVSWTGQPRDTRGPALVAVIYPTSWRAYPARSGLAATAVAAVYTIQATLNATVSPLAGVDPKLADAVDATLTAIHNDLDLNLAGVQLDPLGQAGQGTLSAVWGWVPHDDGLLRACDITCPIIINDAYPQTI